MIAPDRWPDPPVSFELPEGDPGCGICAGPVRTVPTPTGPMVWCDACGDETTAQVPDGTWRAWPTATGWEWEWAGFEGRANP